MAAASNFEKIPSYLVQYYEYDKKIEFAIEMNELPLTIDGLFCPFTAIQRLPGNTELFDSHRLSLGCLRNFRRRPETLDCLIKIGFGIRFGKTKDEWYYVENLSDYPVYIIIKKSPNEKIKLEPKKKWKLFDLKPLIEHKIIPKKVGKIYDEFTINVSFVVPFEKKDDKYMSPCWVEMSLNKIVDAQF